MKPLLAIILPALLVSARATPSAPASTAPTPTVDAGQRSAVEDTPRAYERALNAGNVGDLAALYTPTTPRT